MNDTKQVDAKLLADLISAVTYTLGEVETFRDVETGHYIKRLQRLDCPDGLFDWLRRSKDAVVADAWRFDLDLTKEVKHSCKVTAVSSFDGWLYFLSYL